MGDAQMTIYETNDSKCVIRYQPEDIFKALMGSTARNGWRQRQDQNCRKAKMKEEG